MSRTLLQLVRQAANEIGIPEPQSLFGNQNDTEKQLIALANRESKEFAGVANKNGGWQALHREYTFNTQFLNTTGGIVAGSNTIAGIPTTGGIVAGDWAVTGDGLQAGTRVIQVNGPNQVTISLPAVSTIAVNDLSFGKIAYSIPTDLEYFIDRTFWDNRFKWELIGPITAQEKQILRYGVLNSGPRNKFYIRVDKMWIDPVPFESTMIAYDYFSNAPIITGTNTRSKTWVSDNDTYLLDEDCFIQGIKWRFLRAKGLDYSEEYASYLEDVNRTIGRDGGSRDLPLGGVGYQVQLLDSMNIPDGFWPGR